MSKNDPDWTVVFRLRWLLWAALSVLMVILVWATVAWLASAFARIPGPYR